MGSPVHNEIALCFSGSDSTSLHLSYWYDATAHTTYVALPFEFSSGLHEYGVVWAPDALTFSVDGAVVHTVNGVAGKTIPFAAGYAAVILRPKDDVYISDSAFRVAWMSYNSAY